LQPMPQMGARSAIASALPTAAAAPMPPPSLQPMPLQPMPLQPMPLQPMPLQPMPLQPMPLQPMPLQGMPLPPMPLQPMPLQPMPLQPPASMPHAAPQAQAPMAMQPLGSSPAHAAAPMQLPSNHAALRPTIAVSPAPADAMYNGRDAPAWARATVIPGGPGPASYGQANPDDPTRL